MAAQELYTTPLFSDPNLVSYYRLEGNSNDSKGSNNGTDSNITYSVGNGKFNQGAGFNSASPSSINIGSAAGLSPTALTYSAWINPTSFPNAYNSIISRSNTPTGTPYIALLVKSTGKLAPYVYGSASISYDGTGTNTLSTGSWYLITMTYDSTNGLICYVNGSVDGTAAANGNLASVNNSTGIGYDPFYADRYFNGKIDDVAIFNRSLTATEAGYLYNGFPAGNVAGRVLKYQAIKRASYF